MGNSDITHRFLSCLDLLIGEGKVKSKRQFALSLGYHPQGISEMAARRRDVPLDLIEKAVLQFRFNATFLFSGQGDPFIHPGKDDGLHIRQLTISTDDTGMERIIHVPFAAQAGYGRLHGDPEYISELPAYQLPDPQFRSGTYRSFEISGSSMEPTLRTHDIVIASFVEPRYWIQAIKNGQLHVIVTHQDVIIKRTVNKLKTDQVLECHSDNPDFQPFTIPAEDIREMWRVRLRMTSHLETETAAIHAQDIRDQLLAQNTLLKHLQEQLSQANHS